MAYCGKAVSLRKSRFAVGSCRTALVLGILYTLLSWTRCCHWVCWLSAGRARRFSSTELSHRYTARASGSRLPRRSSTYPQWANQEDRFADPTRFARSKKPVADAVFDSGEPGRLSDISEDMLIVMDDNVDTLLELVIKVVQRARRIGGDVEIEELSSVERWPAIDTKEAFGMRLEMSVSATQRPLGTFAVAHALVDRAANTPVLHELFLEGENILEDKEPDEQRPPSLKSGG
eukprot:TRINITY_DN102770_c0_g1_i1.p2 TRINITY_DN102770_c0_g1~~TRINITY_DN102770_c0_g1_i1.p2  ORF type:complete len:233 (-),score=5.01 TRINITY_DN102770_c0_g1_i1:254-952(-)